MPKAVVPNAGPEVVGAAGVEVDPKTDAFAAPNPPKAEGVLGTPEEPNAGAAVAEPKTDVVGVAPNPGVAEVVPNAGAGVPPNAVGAAGCSLSGPSGPYFPPEATCRNES